MGVKGLNRSAALLVVTMPKKFFAELRAFAETTSVRGIPRVMKAKTRVTFVVWLVAVLTCAALLVWQLSVVLTRYFQYPVNTLTVQSPARSTFPDITVCNLNPVIHLQRLDNADAGAQIYAFLGHLYFRVTDILNSFSLAGSFATKLENEPLIMACSYFDWFGNTYAINCLDTVRAAWNPTYYKCLTLRLNASHSENIRGFSAIMYVDRYDHLAYPETQPSLSKSQAKGLRVLIHAPGTAPDMTLGMSIGPGIETSVLLRQTKRTRLGQPYSNCTDQRNLNGDVASDAYTQRYCVNTCVQQQIVDRCGCVSSRVPQYSLQQLRRVNFTVCEIVSQIRDSNFLDKPTLACSKDLAKNYSVTADCNTACLLPCGELLYDAIPSFAPWPHESALNAYVKTYVLAKGFRSHEQGTGREDAGSDAEFLKTRFLQLNVQFGDPSFGELKDVAAFSADAMGAQIGGLLSLWLGVTVMFLFEAFEFLYGSIIGCRKDEPSRDGDTTKAGSVELLTVRQGVKAEGN